MSFRIPLSQRKLPSYSKKEEQLNMLSHAIGCCCGIAIFILVFTLSIGEPLKMFSAAVYGFSLIALYAVSAVYHGLQSNYAKKVMQVIDHCTIYLLIAGSYTPILLVGFMPYFPALCRWGMVIEWGCAILAATLTAIDLKRFEKLSMFCYIIMGWLIIFMLKPAITVLTISGFGWLLGGGIAYTLGAVLYGIGKKRPYYHFVFHFFTVIGSILQAVCIIVYVL